MLFPGTITLPEEYFAKILEFTARSFKVHGFLDIVFIGDSGGNQPGQKTVADSLNKEWASTRVRVHHAEAYYTANGSTTGFSSKERLSQASASMQVFLTHLSCSRCTQRACVATS